MLKSRTHIQPARVRVLNRPDKPLDARRDRTMPQQERAHALHKPAMLRREIRQVRHRVMQNPMLGDAMRDRAAVAAGFLLRVRPQLVKSHQPANF